LISPCVCIPHLVLRFFDVSTRLLPPFRLISLCDASSWSSARVSFNFNFFFFFDLPSCRYLSIFTLSSIDCPSVPIHCSRSTRHIALRGPFREPPSNIKSRFRVLNPIVGFPLFSHDGRFPVLVVYSPLQSMSPLCPLQPTGIQPFNCSSIALGPQLCILGILVVDSRSRYSVLRLDAPHLSQGAFREPPF